MARKDYIPDSAVGLRDWTQNLSANLAAVATRINWPTASVTDLTAQLTRLGTASQAVIDAQNALEAAAGQLATARAEAVPIVRRHVTNLKSTAGFDDGDARSLDLLSPAETFDPHTYQPQVTAAGQHGRIVINGRKHGADALNLYVRRQGEAPWRLLAAKRSGFPFEDTAASATGAPEVREYQAVGIEGDAEIGQPSDIVTAVWQP